MNLIILTPADEIAPDSYRVTDQRAEHIRNILKANVGDCLAVARLNGPHGQGRVIAIDTEGVELATSAWVEPDPIMPEIILICALPRPQTLKRVLLTSAMMGVKAAHFIRANRVEKSFFQSPLTEPENQLPYLMEGLAQGKNSRLPEITIHDRFRHFFEDKLNDIDGGPAPSMLRLVGDSDQTATLNRVVDGKPERLTLAIGPEGGWVPFELELMDTLGFRRFTLGRWTLRVEHAVTAALSQVELRYRTS